MDTKDYLRSIIAIGGATVFFHLIKVSATGNKLWVPLVVNRETNAIENIGGYFFRLTNYRRDNENNIWTRDIDNAAANLSLALYDNSTTLKAQRI